MFVVQPGRWNSRDEELRAVRACSRSCVLAYGRGDLVAGKEAITTTTVDDLHHPERNQIHHLI
jgi:hypothetical protein